MALVPKSQRLFYLAAIAVVVMASVLLVTAQRTKYNNATTTNAQDMQYEYEMPQDTETDMYNMDSPNY
jgi:hypothetical protein